MHDPRRDPTKRRRRDNLTPDDVGHRLSTNPLMLSNPLVRVPHGCVSMHVRASDSCVYYLQARNSSAASVASSAPRTARPNRRRLPPARRNRQPVPEAGAEQPPATPDPSIGMEQVLASRNPDRSREEVSDVPGLARKASVKKFEFAPRRVATEVAPGQRSRRMRRSRGGAVPARRRGRGGARSRRRVPPPPPPAR